MRHRTLILVVAALAVAATGCDRKPAEQAKAPPAPPAAPPPPAHATTTLTVADGYRHQAGIDASGYYLSPTNFRIGGYQFSHLAIGAPSDFQTWEKGDRASTFGPILIAFDDTTSPLVANEMGGEGHTVSVRVLPDAYSFDASTLTFRGKDPKLGEVVFVGAFDQAALARARAEGSTQATVLAGDLKVGAAPAQKVALTYFVGD